MAFIVIPSPSSTTGPCVELCAHTDCAESRRDAALKCHACGKPNGYGTKLVTWGPGLGHYGCCLVEAEGSR